MSVIMDVNKTEFVDKTVLNTPKPTATSTVNKFQKKKRYRHSDLENSLGLSSLNGMDLSDVEHKNRNEVADVGCQLQQQRMLASSSLQRANKVSSIPSKYLRPNINNTSSVSNFNLSTGSTINESDLSRKSPTNTSTPKSSVVAKDFYENNSEQRLSLGQSMAQLSYQIGNTDISIDNFVKEFQKAMKSVDNGSSSKIDSNMFTPAEDAASMLLADELSWRRQNDIPVTSNFSQIEVENASCGKVSVGAFFNRGLTLFQIFKLL
ncbi:hypothetical protein NQ314_003611 [Rhamnusium bicolor]|uniref:Uncharacterized protein n=1 Tax=Rhamnusium bicolor TaxID=1586634 RepID=A0AAV8ZNL0_9CUCU|nr:hypothetical protein NQ314_003611 [Rhamnusium bicolor]